MVSKFMNGCFVLFSVRVMGSDCMSFFCRFFFSEEELIAFGDDAHTEIGVFVRRGAP